MDDITILKLQDQVSKLRKQMIQVKKEMKEPPCIDGISLDPTIYLRWVQTLENYTEVIGHLSEDSFMIATQKL